MNLDDLKELRDQIDCAITQLENSHLHRVMTEVEQDRFHRDNHGHWSQIGEFRIMRISACPRCDYGRPGVFHEIPSNSRISEA